MTRPSNRWLEQNQRYLDASIREVTARLGARLGDDAQTAAHASAEPMPHQDSAETLEAPPALEILRAVFQLSPFETDLLVLAAGAELSSSTATTIARAHADPSRSLPTFGLALASMREPHWAALGPTGALRHWQLLEVLPGAQLTSSPLRINERTLGFLIGLSAIDERLRPYLDVRPTRAGIARSHARLAAEVADGWSRAVEGAALQVVSTSPADGRAVVTAAASLLGIALLVIRGADLPTAPVELEPIVRLLVREALFTGGAIVVDEHDVDAASAAGPHAWRRLLARAPAPVAFLCGPNAARDISIPKLEVGDTTWDEQRDLWLEALGADEGVRAALEGVLGHFRLDATSIADVAHQLSAPGRQRPTTVAAWRSVLWEGCRTQLRRNLQGLAERIEPRATWDDLVLPEPQESLLRDLLAQVEHRHLVYHRWGFDRSQRGLGITALFAGPSGVGKTLAAEVIAARLELDLYRIDLSQVVNKYIGETEKNLKRVFDAADAGGAVLLFDEADALFGRRSEVKDSHDRYANLEVGYLLQRMESHRGLAILTTNMKDALDPAFLRRLRFVVQFPFPDAKQRARIWARAFPSPDLRAGLDVARFAEVNLSGGDIRNITLYAAFLAARDGKAIVENAHVERAIRVEMAKLERAVVGLGGAR